MRYPFLILLALAVCPPSVFGGSFVGGGGGNSFGQDFLDSVLAKSPYVPANDSAYGACVRPTLDYVRANLPFLAEDMEMIISKPWFKAKRKLAVNVSGDAAYDSDQVAYQDRNGIYVDESLYSPGKDHEQDRCQLILHEAIQGLRIEKMIREPKGQDASGNTGVMILSNELFARSAKTPIQMQALVNKYLHTVYATADFLKALPVPSRGAYQNRIKCKKTGEQSWLIPQFEVYISNGGVGMDEGNAQEARDYMGTTQPAKMYRQDPDHHVGIGILNVPPGSDDLLLMDAYFRYMISTFSENWRGFYSTETILLSQSEYCENQAGR